MDLEFYQISGQITILPKPELRKFGGGFPDFSPPFGLTNPAGTGRDANLPRNLQSSLNHWFPLIRPY